MQPVFYARWSDDRLVAQSLREHLIGVAELAEGLAHDVRPYDTAFSIRAKLAGLLHDVGKYRREFQAYLNSGDRGKRSAETDHAVYGAAAGGVVWQSLDIAFAVGGHHAGLHDEHQLMAQIRGSRYQALDRFPHLLETADGLDELVGALRHLSPRHEDASDSVACLHFDDDDESDKRRFEVFVRMLFSILVDADRLDSERFEQQHRLSRKWSRAPRRLDADTLLKRIIEERLHRQADRPLDELTRVRNDVFDACLECGANQPQGFFSLTVPTGGAKTLSSMAFALAHAKQHGLRRVFVVIPYLSIIEQNAGIYRRVLGKDQVLEHHSAVGTITPKQASAGDELHDPSQSLDVERAMENWDVPIIVTTSVQFLETLFAAKAGRARKLHSIARSVIIFDEVQTLPTHLLEPTLDVLRTLRKHFGVSFLFCSATQPGFRKSGNLKQGLRQEELKPVIADPSDLFRKLQRVRYYIAPLNERWDWGRLAFEMVAQPQALAVLNLRQHAFDVYNAVKKVLADARRNEEAHEAVFHLSSAMCAQHRFDLLGQLPNPATATIRGRLRDGKPCFVVSTQLIEAGVDIDFPVVFRAMGPLESIVQTAGRCNREGLLHDEHGQRKLGDVIVFHPELPDGSSGLPPGLYDKATKITPAYVSNIERLATDPNLFADYFNELFQITPTDRDIQSHRANFNFRTVGERAKVIEALTATVVVPYGVASKMIDRIRKAGRVDRGVLRRLQRYMVSLRIGEHSLYQQLDDGGRLTGLLSNLDLKVVDADCYDSRRGILFKERPPEDFIV